MALQRCSPSPLPGALLIALSLACLPPSAAAQESPGHPSLSAAIGEVLYRVEARPDGGWEAGNPAQRMHSTFSAAGVEVAEGGRTLALALEAWGREGALQPALAAEVRSEGRRVEYRRGPVVEWYVNDRRGLEQGFTVARAPGDKRGDRGGAAGWLELRLTVGGGLAPEVDASRRAAHFARADGEVVFHYTGLVALDAEGRALDAELASDGEALSIRVDDRDATYPLLIDPWVWTEEAKLMASDAADNDRFGAAAALSGDTALVGAPFDDDDGPRSGSAYVFVRSGTLWTEQAKLTASDAASTDQFGASVSLDGDTALIGAPEKDGPGLHSGSAYVFQRTGTVWSEQAALTSSDLGGIDRFGTGVSVQGDTAVIGAPFDKDLGPDSGSAYVFERSGTVWTEEAKLLGSGVSSGARFGASVALDGDTVLIGPGVQVSKQAYVFRGSGSTWTEEALLVPSLSNGFPYFGFAVALDGDTALVGAWNALTPIRTGAAFAYVRSGTVWTEEAVLTALDGVSDDYFGYSLALEGDTALVCAPGDDDLGYGSGSAYTFQRSAGVWFQQSKITGSQGAVNDRFGDSAALSGGTLLVGAAFHDAAGADAGAAYTFAAAPPVGESYCTSGVSASGCQALMSASGTPSATAEAGFFLTAINVEGAKNGLFFYGTNGRQANPWGNGGGFVCVIPPRWRGGLLVAFGSTAGACDGTFTQDLNARWCPACPKPAHNPSAGALMQAQLWYRDPFSTSNQSSGMSDAIEFTIGP